MKRKHHETLESNRETCEPTTDRRKSKRTNENGNEK